jgi:hypothetical protein
LVRFYWANTEVVEAAYTVLSTDIAGDEVKRTLPWSYIEAAYNNPQLPLAYSISHPGEPNYQRSQPTLVNADAVTLIAPTPTFEGLYNGTMINCDSLWEVPGVAGPNEPAIRVRVPDLSQAPWNRKDGDIITVHWVATDPSGNVLAGTELSRNITLGTDNPVTGFVWKVYPYATHILPTYNPPAHQTGLGLISYAFLLGTEKINSVEDRKIIALATPSSSCEVTPAP